jgi:predicted O-linked N-acetylglucosamine transferase (SPINDLY family)
MSEVQTLLQSAIALHRSGQLAEAEVIYRQLLADDPNQPDALQLLGAIAHQQEQYGASIQLIRRSLAIVPTGRQPLNNLGESLRATGQIDEAIATFRRALELYPNYTKAHSNLLLTLHYQTNYDPLEVRREHELWAARHADYPPTFTLSPDRDPNRPLRIGLISADLRRHSVGYFIEPLIEKLDLENYPLWCYFNHARGDEVTARLRARATGWRDIVAMDDDAVANQIRQDKIDILIDLAGHMAGNRLLVMARKPAPVQATYLGYPNGTGMKQVDWRISDAIADLPGKTNDHYVERVIRLEGCAWCYAAPEFSPEPVEVPPNRPITFGSFNNFAKVSSPVLFAWAQLLREIPESRLLIKAKSLGDQYARQLAMEKLKASTIPLDRVTIMGWKSGVREHLAMYNEIDIALDPFFYNGTTSTCEALWMGVPVLNLVGDAHLGRVGESLLTAAGMPECATHGPERFMQQADKLVKNRPSRRELRERVRNSPLMDASAFARNFEEALRRMWRSYLGGVDSAA